MQLQGFFLECYRDNYIYKLENVLIKKFFHYDKNSIKLIN